MCVCISFLHEPAECFPRPIIEGQFTGSECRDHVSCKSPLQSGIEHEEREEGVGGGARCHVSINYNGVGPQSYILLLRLGNCLAGLIYALVCWPRNN